MPTHNQAGIDFDSLKASDGHNAQMSRLDHTLQAGPVCASFFQRCTSIRTAGRKKLSAFQGREKLFLIVRTASDQDVYAKDRSIAHNPRETEEHKEHAREEIHKMVEAERHTAAGLKGTILNPRASDHEKAVAAERLVRLPDWEDEPTTKTTTN